jgi:hypothetical protein
MDRAALDAAYNNTLAVNDSVRFLADWDARSRALAKASPQHLDSRYGDRERNRIDFFPAARKGGPLLAFIHGGYWQMRAKETFRFVAQGPLAHGIDVALIGYTLAPETTLGGIVEEVHSALTWLAANAPQFGSDEPDLRVGLVSGRSNAGRATRCGHRVPALLQTCRHTAVCAVVGRRFPRPHRERVRVRGGALQCRFPEAETSECR